MKNRTKTCWDFFNKPTYSKLNTSEIELDSKPVVTNMYGKVKNKSKYKTRVKPTPSEYYIVPKDEEVESKLCCF